MKRFGGRASIVIASLLLAVGVVAGVANREVLDGSAFASHANAVRTDDNVSALIGQEISAQILRYDQDLVALRPAIDAVMIALVRTPAFSPIVEAAIVQIHEAFTTPGSSQIVLRLADLTAVVIAALKTVAPSAVSFLPADFDVRLAGVGGQSFAASVVHATRVVDLLAWLLPLLAILGLGIALCLSSRRQRTLAFCGLAVATSGLFIAVASVIAGAYTSAADTKQLGAAIVSASWDEFSPSLWRSALALAIGGLMIFAAAGAYLPQWSIDGGHQAVGQRAVRWVRDPGTGPRPQILSGIALATLGALALYRPLETARMIIILLALAAITEGVTRISRVSAAKRSADDQAAPTAQGARTRRQLTSRVIVALAAAGLAAYLVVAALPVNRRVATSVLTNPINRTGCNGQVELCTRRYDQVAYVATHNSMSAADQSGWFIPEQPTGLIGQLDAGVRTLLIDTWYGQQTDRDGVITNAPADRAAALSAANAAYGADVVQSALRLRAALDLRPRGPVEPYMCHALCELGSTLLLPAMQQVQHWLGTHPREVVTVIIEDNVTPDDTAKVFQDAGLMPYVHTQPVGQAWPTLGEMIDAGHRVQVFMQRQAGDAAKPWLIKAFDWIQDTPYDNPAPESLSCTRLRGEPTNSLLLINNVLTRFSTRVSDSTRINAFDVLYPYVSRCEQQRGQIPNFIAVDYYSKGDVFGVVDRLNGVG